MERRSTGRQPARPLELSWLRLTIVAVGRLKAGPERELFARYVERVGALAAHVGISGVDWREVAEGRAGRLEDRRAEEARAILAAVPKGGWLVVLDERGSALTSTQWAAEIARARDGFCPSLRRRHRRSGRPRSGVARRRPFGDQLRRDDLAASAGARDGRRAALPRAVDPGGPSVSPGVSAPVWRGPRPEGIREVQSSNTKSTPSPHTESRFRTSVSTMSFRSPASTTAPRSMTA